MAYGDGPGSGRRRNGGIAGGFGRQPVRLAKEAQSMAGRAVAWALAAVAQSTIICAAQP